jgi:hypothetical protein
MTRRPRILVAAAAIAALLAVSALPVLAKEGAIAKLDTAIHRDAEPGSTIDVGWSVFMVTSTGEEPVYGSPIYIKLVAPDGSSTEAGGTERPAGSGHYTAPIVVPQGGIQDVIVAMVGTACYDGGGCQRADYVFPLTDDVLVSGAPAQVPAARTTTGTPVGPALAPLVAVGTAFALIGGLGALIVARRRQVRVETAGVASGD